MDDLSTIHARVRAAYGEDSAIMEDGQIWLSQSQRFLTEAEAEAVRPSAQDRLKAQVEARRDEAIAAGIVIDGLPVQTDDISQQRITGAALAASLDPTLEVRWKVGNGAFVTLDAASVIAIAQAVRAHVQACFDREADLRDAIDAGEAPDVESAWPGGAGP
jgi:hypothetical protein